MENISKFWDIDKIYNDLYGKQICEFADDNELQ